jgi:hypothetical protein
MRPNPSVETDAEKDYTWVQVARATVGLFWREQRDRWADRVFAVRRALTLYVRMRLVLARLLRFCPSIPEAYRFTVHGLPFRGLREMDAIEARKTQRSPFYTSLKSDDNREVEFLIPVDGRRERRREDRRSGVDRRDDNPSPFDGPPVPAGVEVWRH